MDEKLFDKYEKRGAYHWEWYASNRHKYADKVHMILAQLPSQGTVLDIGGGDGLISYKLFEKGLDVTCVDSNTHSIELARDKFEEQIFGTGARASLRKYLAAKGLLVNAPISRYLNKSVSLLDASIFETHFAQPFDFVVCHEVIEHVPEPVKLLEYIVSHMRQFAIISTPDTTNHAPHPLDYHTWTPASLTEFLTGHKFEFILQDGHEMYVKIYKQ